MQKTPGGYPQYLFSSLLYLNAIHNKNYLLEFYAYINTHTPTCKHIYAYKYWLKWFIA